MYFIRLKNLLSHIKMAKKTFSFVDIETEKHKFYRHKSLVFIRDVDNEKVLVSSKISFDKKTICIYKNYKLVASIMMIRLSHYI